VSVNTLEYAREAHYGGVVVGRKTNRQRRDQKVQSAEKAAAARAIQERAEQQRRAYTILGSVVAVAIVGVLILVIALHSSTPSAQQNDRTNASPAVLRAVTSVTPASLQTVGEGGTSLLAKPTSGDPAITVHGKPDLLYVGAEFCPYCAAERWSLIQALSRFGTFSNLSEIRSASDDGNIATFSFYKSSYTSRYLSFTPVEAEDRNHAVLETPTPAQASVWEKYAGGGFPFIDFGGKYYQASAGYNFDDLSGLDQQQIAAQLKDPTSKVAQDILGEANNLTATICKLTDNQPASACSPSTITALQGRLAA
jgi:hypothetical protein